MKGYLSVCAIYKNEARYLAEWLEFHLLAGVEHFFLYNNDSTDDHREVLAPYLHAGVVTLTDWPDSPAQIPAYNHCLETNRHDWRWIAFIDLDEFLFSPRMVPVGQVLAGHEDLPAVAALWMIFGTSDHKTPPPGLVVENYTWRRTFHDRSGRGRASSTRVAPGARAPPTSSATPIRPCADRCRRSPRSATCA